MANKPVFRKISTAAEAQKNNNSNSHNSSKEERADVARSSDKPVFKKVRTAWGGDVSSIQTPSQKSPSSNRQQWVANDGGRKSTSPTAGIRQGASNRDIAAENRKKVEQLQNQRRQAAMDLDTDTVNRLDREIKTLQTNPGTLERVAKTVTGGAKSSGAAYTNTLGYVQEGSRNARDVDINSWEEELRRAQYEIQNADNNADRIYWQLEASKIQDNIQNAQKMTERSTTSAQNNYRRADELAESAAGDLDRAKEGAGFVGRMLVDAGASMTQSTLDALPNLLTGGAVGMAPFAIRAFGGAAQQARQNGATWGQQGLYGAASAAKEVFTEKMFNIALPFAKAYGGGALDDVVARGIRSAVDKFAKTDAGKNALGAALTFGAGAVSEGLEEFIGDWMEWQLPRIYGGDVATAQETFSDSLYDFLVGATSGAMGGIVSPNTYRYDLETAQTGQQADAVDPRVQQIMNTMNAQEGDAGGAKAVERTPSVQRETVRQAESARPAVPAEVQEILRQEAAVRRSFTGVQDTLGESGKKAFQTAYQQGTDRGNYTGEFLRAYHAGITGQENPNGISDVSFAAYTAGKDDAAASLAREKRAAQFAGTAGTDSGLVFDHYVENQMESAVADEVNAVSKALGVRVQMVDQVLGGLGNGDINGSEIQIAKDARDPALRVVGHEWTHRVQELAPDTYRSFRDAVTSLPDVQDAVQILLEQYNAADIETSYEQALDEATANYAGEMIENSNVLDDFIRKHGGNRTLLQKLRDAIHEIVSKLTGRAKRQAQTVEGKLQAAFEAAAKQAESLQDQQSNGTMQETRYAVKGKYWRPDLTQNEWSVLNRRMEQEITDSTHALDEATQWAYANENGNQVFAIYGIGDGTEATPLYAVGGKKAAAQYEVFKLWMEGSNGEIDRNRKSLDRIFENIKSKSGRAGDNVSTAEEGAAADGNVQISLEERNGNGTTDSGSGQENRRVNTRYSLKDYSDVEQRDHRKKAIAFFGKTYNWNETGYLTPAGTKLDFSGRHEGAPGGYRTVDHRDIRDAISEDYGGDDYSGSMVQFMSEGNIRISPESGGINLSVEPTKAQLDSLSDFINKNRGEVILDLDTPDGNTVSSTEYPRGTHASKVLNDIKTYFKDGTIPHVSEVSQFLSLKGTENAQELAALKRENERLKERMEYWKGQTRRSQGVTTDRKSVAKAANALVKDYGAEISGSEIAGELQSLYDYISSGKDGKDELTYTEARRRSDAIAEKIAESAVAVDDQTYQEYAELRKYLRETRLTLSSEDAANITDYADFRKEQFGKLKIGKGEHTNVDQIYAQLSNQYPEFFNEQREANVSDQLQRIADVAGQLYTVTEYNPFEGYMGQAVASISNDIMDRFFDLPQTKKTFADRAAEQVQEAKRAGRQAANDAFLAGQMAQGRMDAKRLRSTADALAKERTRRAEQVQALRERYREKDATRRESQQSRELRARITRHANALSQKLLRPTDAQHIPEEMRTAVARVLDSINQESAYTLDENGKRVYDGSGTPTKRTEAFRNLKEQYRKIAAEGDMVIDPSLFGADNKADGQAAKGSFDEVIDMGETRLSDLTNAQLKTMWNVLKTVEHSVKTAGKMLASEKFSTTKQFAGSLLDGLMLRRNKHGNNTSISLETPYTFFSHFGQTGKDIYRMLRNAQDRQELMSRNVAEKVQNILDGKAKGHGLVGKVEELRGNNVWKMNTDTREFTTTEGKTLTLTPAQAMEIYLLSKREQAQAHLMKGGIVQPEILSAATGKTRIERGTESIRLSEKDLQTISGSLTAEQVRMADALQKLTAGVLADYGNEASMKAYGYKKFTEEHYWPIRTAKEALHSSVEKNSENVRAIKNIGMAQALTPNATAALDVSGVFDTFSRHASDMIDYAAWLCPMEDANRLFNFKYQDEKGNLTGKTVKGLLDEKGGKGSQEYWTKLMGDIQNGIGGRGFEPLTNWFAKQVGRFKAAAAGANIRVVAQQFTAFHRASIVLSRADMARGLASGVTKGDGWKKALKYSPIAMRKDVGSFDISSPYTLSDRFYGQSGFATKINDKAGSLAGKADALTWGKLWNACEWQVKREKPNLRPGSNEFYSEVNKVFTDMIDQTQVVDGILQRSNIMRSNNDLAQQATAFMGEPIMSLNDFMRSYDEFKYEQDPVKRGKALKKMGRTVTSLVETAVVNAAVQSLMDGIRDDDRDKDYWERVWEAFTGITGDEENWAQTLKNITLNGNAGGNLNPLGQIPFVKDILSITQGYDVSRPDMETFSDLVDAAKTFIDSAGGNGKKTQKEALIGLLAAAAKMVGLPLYNVKRDAVALLRTIALQSGNIPFQYEIEKFTYNIGSEKNKSRYMALLYDALEQGDYTSFEHIREDLMANMPDIDGAKIDSSMSSLYKKKLDKNPEYTLPKKAMDYIGIHGGYAEEEQEDTFDAGDLDAAAYGKYSDQRAETYRSAEDTINASSAFQSADSETKNRALKNAESFAKATALADASGGKYKISENSWILKAQEAQKKYGIDPGTFSLLRAQASGVEGLKDKDGETIKNSRGYQIMQIVYNGIRDEKQRKAMFEYLGVPKGIQHMNKAAVEEKLRNMRKQAAK